MLIPLANVLLLYFLAFAEWPNQARDDRPSWAGQGGRGADRGETAAEVAFG